MPEMLGEFVYGIPELHREEIRELESDLERRLHGDDLDPRTLSAFPGRRGRSFEPTVIEAKTGSSGSGGSPGLARTIRSGAASIRSFKPTGHRHTAEIIQELTFDGHVPEIAFSATSVEAVRGILATSHVYLKEPMSDKESGRSIALHIKEPFMRIVKESTGIHRYPEPKILSGTNYCDVGFERDPHLEPDGRHGRARQSDEGRGRPGGAGVQYPARRFPAKRSGWSSRGCIPI